MELLADVYTAQITQSWMENQVSLNPEPVAPYSAHPSSMAWMDCHLTSSRAISHLRLQSILSGDQKYICPSWIGSIREEGFL